MTLTFHAPQIIWICLAVVSITYEATQHGKPRTGNRNVWTSLIGTVIFAALFYWGGFFGGR